MYSSIFGDSDVGLLFEIYLTEGDEIDFVKLIPLKKVDFENNLIIFILIFIYIYFFLKMKMKMKWNKILCKNKKSKF